MRPRAPEPRELHELADLREDAFGVDALVGHVLPQATCADAMRSEVRVTRRQPTLEQPRAVRDLKPAAPGPADPFVLLKLWAKCTFQPNSRGGIRFMSKQVLYLLKVFDVPLVSSRRSLTGAFDTD